MAVDRWRARPTTYRGIPMRSRLEASVAAELDRTLPGRWEYEPRAFADESGQYLPDFVVDGSMYVEVKPTIELALRATERMQIIWSSEPEAILVIFISQGGGIGIGLTARGSDRVWRRA
jgi:hypothetical protein